MKTDILNFKNEKVDTFELPENLFNVKWNPSLVHQIWNAMAANKRRPWAHTKGRGDVRGGGKKPWRQKGTGRARAGSSRSPIWKGGGVTFGPDKIKNYGQKINKKMKTAALLSVLSHKVKDGEFKILNELDIAKPKTKLVSNILDNLLNKNKKNNPSVLIVPSEPKKDLIRAGRNIQKTMVIYPRQLNVYDCLTHKFVIFEKKSLEDFISNFSK